MADDSHAVVEWAGQPGQQAVRDMINDRVPFGVLEMKAAWVIDDPDRNRCRYHRSGPQRFPYYGCP